MNKKYTLPTSFYGVLISIISIVVSFFSLVAMTCRLVLRPRRGSLRNSTSTWEIAIILREFLRQSARGDIVAGIAGPNLRVIYRKIRILVGTTGDIGCGQEDRRLYLSSRRRIFADFYPHRQHEIDIKQSIYRFSFFFFMFSINYRPCVKSSSSVNHPAYLCPIPFIRT